MTLDEVKILLDGCVIDTLSDFSFEGSEISWLRDGREVAAGYFSKRRSTIAAIDGSWAFEGGDADILRKHGQKRVLPS